ncbi:rhomboid family intramembrane serine protease [Tsukamurella sp. 8F]|uniref:rhomboid family intramembrane serine protease n=1 Tax=unclassified Tsukamurella TaxID=2633480 RepID=UPI0023B8F3B9|nr:MULTISPECIES: rhomboid family intramembrane serine protease [unclassified Tsukamurella]MDF0528635.1 rhomboid family intramembrane serine protease [Tsukamurella sp. 8J]MDF0585597.1 rhomboid family intramembrane serine protease [Tsukamurella sp. 8F]
MLINMYSLWVLGRTVEAGMGRAQYAMVYALSLLGGSASVLWFDLGPGHFTAGASGAIFGVMGAELILLLKLRLNPTGLLVVIGANLVLSFTVSGISLFGHLGGLVVGLVLAAVMLYGPQLLPSASRTRMKASAIGWVGAAAVAFVVCALIGVRFEELSGVTRILTTVPVG